MPRAAWAHPSGASSGESPCRSPGALLAAAALAGFARSLADFGLTVIAASHTAGPPLIWLLLAIAAAALAVLYAGNRVRMWV